MSQVYVGKHCILALIISDKSVKKEAFRSTLTKIWRPVGWITFKDMDDNKFLVEFQNLGDKEKVLKGRSWLFDRNLVNLQDFDASLSAQDTPFLNNCGSKCSTFQWQL